MNKMLLVLMCLPFLMLLPGCIKDRCERTRKYTYYEPVYKTSAEVRENIRSNKPRAIENPGKLFVRGNYIFLNEVDKGVHIIDNSNPTAPDNVAFIDIPGNLDLAVRGNILYADLYTDLVSIDISAPLAAQVVHYNEGVFPHRNYGYGFGGDSARVITDWIKRDTIVNETCNWSPIWNENFMDGASGFSSGSAVSSSPVGKGGSMARFTIIQDHMYTVSYSNLVVFNVSAPEKPRYVKEVRIENLNMVETIYPLENQLFIGAQNGMNIYDVSKPASPALTGEFAHVQSCDPVISDGVYAYVTLRSGTSCQGFTNQLEVLKLSSFTNPKLMKTYPLTNPHGLSKDGNLLFICDGEDGLKIFNADDVMNLKLLHHVQHISTYDIITMNGIALVVAKDGLYQYAYDTGGQPRFLSRLGINKKTD